MMRNGPGVTSSLALALALGACGPGEDIGEVEVALTAVGDDGAIYRLPDKTSLILESAPRFYESFLLDGDAPSLGIELPVGRYTWHVTRNTGTPEEWPLERHLPSGEVEIVMATLLSVQPGELQIVPDVRTGLVITFEAARGGTLTFATGVADVSVDVGATDTLGGLVDWYSTTTTVTIHDRHLPPELFGVDFPTIGDTGFSVYLDARVSGAWEPNTSRSVCAPLLVEHTPSSSNQAYRDLVIEAAGGLADLCVYDDGNVVIELRRDGIGTSPTFEPMGTTPLRFKVSLTGTLPQPAFDGRTLDLSILAGIYKGLPAGGTYEVLDISDPAAPRLLYYFEDTGQLNDFTFAPAKL